HEQARVPRVATDVGERSPALAPLRLEERRLRLDRDSRSRDSVDDPATELDDAESLWHERRIRIEPDAERRAFALHCGREPIREMTLAAHHPSGYEAPGTCGPETKRPPEGGLSILGGDFGCR